MSLKLYKRQNLEKGWFTIGDTNLTRANLFKPDQNPQGTVLWIIDPTKINPNGTFKNSYTLADLQTSFTGTDFNYPKANLTNSSWTGWTISNEATFTNELKTCISANFASSPLMGVVVSFLDGYVLAFVYPSNRGTDISTSGSDPFNTGLDAYYKMENNANDSSLNSRNGTGGAFTGSYKQLGNYSLSSNFTINSGVAPVLGSDPFSMQFWAYYTNNQGTLISSAGGNGGFIVCHHSANKLSFRSNTSGWWFSGVTFSPNTWTHVVLTRDSNNLTSIYIGGAFALSTYSISGTMGDSGATIAIGEDITVNPYDGQGPWQGYLDEVIIWKNRCLSAGEVNSLWNNNAGHEIVVSADSPPGAPLFLTAGGGDQQVSLSWGSAAGASSYNIKRGLTSGSEALLFSGVTGTTYINTGLTNGTPYYYKVSGSNTYGEGSDSAEAFATPSGLSAGVTAYYKMESNGNDSQGSYGGTGGTFSTSTKFKGLASLQSSYITISNGLNFSTNPFSFQTWIYPTTGNGGLLDSYNNKFTIALVSGVIWWRASAAGSAWLNTGVAVTTNAWNHIVITRGGSNDWKTYKNGSIAATNTFNYSLGAAGAPLYIGADLSQGQGVMAGYTDEVAIWLNRTLSSDDVLALWHNGFGVEL